MEEIYGANCGPLEPWPEIVPDQQINVLKGFYAQRIAAEDMAEVFYLFNIRTMLNQSRDCRDQRHCSRMHRWGGNVSRR
jgi:hypothetical protein